VTCNDCRAEGADCLTADRVRVCSDCLYERVVKERDEARADLQNLRDILLFQIPLTKEPGTNVELLRQLVQQRNSARAKAIQFDLDRAGIEQRAAEAAELVDLRAEVERLERLFQQTHGVHHTWVDSRHSVAERQREADTRNVCGDTCRRAIRRTPLVTEVDK